MKVHYFSLPPFRLFCHAMASECRRCSDEAKTWRRMDGVYGTWASVVTIASSFKKSCQRVTKHNAASNNMQNEKASHSPIVSALSFHLILQIALLISFTPTCSSLAGLPNRNVSSSRYPSRNMATTTEISLIPSQAMAQTSSRSGTSKRKDKAIKGEAFSLVPSQVRGSHVSSFLPMTRVDSLPTSDADETDDAESRSNHNTHKAKNRGSRKKTKSGKGKNTKNSSSPSPKTRRHGNFPDVYWRRVPMEHLRLHPNYVPLPLPESIDHIEQLEDIRRFRQESWQWDAVHEGRCTTSQAVAALGFLEPEAGRILGVPRSWLRGGIGAYHRLRRPALRTLEEMNAVLCSSRKNENGHLLDDYLQDSSSIWIPNHGNDKSQFAARYCIPVSEKERQQRRKEMRHRYHHVSDFDSSVRMIWGSIQEATALLTALNYFVQQEGSETKLYEIGMCGAGVELKDSKLLLGATPDGLICHPDGMQEVLEVKNHCPFYTSSMRSNNNNHSQSRFTIRPGHFFTSNNNDEGEDETKKRAGVLPHYVPQLMMEMYCTGTHCRSAVMVRQTATAGALIIRIHRDDEWIEEMLYWLRRFQSDYVDTGTPPPNNFFLETNGEDDASSSRYRRFLDWTIALEAKVDLLDHVPNHKIQRANSATPGGLVDLFLDWLIDQERCTSRWWTQAMESLNNGGVEVHGVDTGIKVA